MKLPIFVFEGNSINRNRILIAWKGYQNVIQFNIISDFYISTYPVSYWLWYIQIRLYIIT